MYIREMAVCVHTHPHVYIDIHMLYTDIYIYR
jgi:hypothetical protein